MEAVVGAATVAVAVLGVFAWIGLSRWSQVDGQALTAARAIAGRELDLLQGLCRDNLDTVIAEGSGRSCGYSTPLGTWVEAPGYRVPGLAFRVTVEPVQGDKEAASFDLAKVTVAVRWQRPFVARVEGRRDFVGYVYGHSGLYWEEWEEWQGR